MLKRKLILFLLTALCAVQLTMSAFASPFVGFTFDSNNGFNVSVNGDQNLVSSEEAYSNMFATYKSIAQVITGICIITSLICFLYQIAKLGAAGDNDRQRKSAVVGILISGLVLTAFGGLEVFVSVFWNALA